jgi:hypothetical protein
MTFLLSWDHEDTPRLVGQLSPPASQQAAERVLRRVYEGYSRELYRERYESQMTKQVKKELRALQKALAGLSPRTADVLRAELKKGPFMPHPYHQGRLVIDPRLSGVPWLPWLSDEGVPGEILLRMTRLAVERVLQDVPELKQRRPGTVSRATRRALECLCSVYCYCHNAPRRTKSRNPEALEFAVDCLRAWYAPIGRLEPADLIRSLAPDKN